MNNNTNLIKLNTLNTNKTLKIMVGASGSGKSTFINKDIEHINVAHVVISPDNERRRLSRDVSDQSVSRQAFENCFEMLDNVMSRDDVDVVYWDATTLNLKSLNNILRHVDVRTTNVEVYCHETSRDWKKCYSRVEKDIKDGVDRANSLGNNVKGKPIIKDMSERYIFFVDEILPTVCKTYGLELKLIDSPEEKLEKVESVEVKKIKTEISSIEKKLDTLNYKKNDIKNAIATNLSITDVQILSMLSKDRKIEYLQINDNPIVSENIKEYAKLIDKIEENTKILDEKKEKLFKLEREQNKLENENDKKEEYNIEKIQF